MFNGKKSSIVKRILSIFLVTVLFCETALGSGEIVLASLLEDVVMDECTTDDSSEAVEIEQEYDTENLEILFEAEEERDISTKHYRLSDGSMMAADYGMAVHYEDDGEWKEIDNRFVYEAATENDPMEGFTTAEGDTKFKFAAESGNSGAVRAETGDYSVSFQFLGETDAAVPAAVNEIETEAPITFIKGDILNAEDVPETLAASLDGASRDSEGAVTFSSAGVSSYAAVSQPGGTLQSDSREEEGLWMDVGFEQAEEDPVPLIQQAAAENAVTSVGYEDVRPGVSLQYMAKGNSLKEYILLSGPQDVYEYSFRLELGGLEAVQGEDGRISLYDPELGTEVFEIPDSYMTDAAGAYSDVVEMVLTEESEDSCILTITADGEWIEDETRVFPVAIDPTLNEKLSTSSNIRGFYVIEEKPAQQSVNYGWMYVGYDGSGYGEMETYIQLRNLSPLPEDSVICASVFNMAVVYRDEMEHPKLHVDAVEVTGTTGWSSSYSYNTRPATDTAVLDRETITEANVTDDSRRYVGWNITELVKEHYSEGNVSGDVFAFALKPAERMSDSGYVSAALNLTWDGAEPILQTFYRDTRGVEGYYSYQNQEAGHAGTAYVGDYTSQLTVVKPLLSYSGTAISYDLGLVYNSSMSGGYFTGGGNLHTEDFGTTILGRGWKLTAQETVCEVQVTDTDGTETYLVHNDSDGTEHYYRRTESDGTKYEDEDGLGITVTKSGTDYTMTDKQDNVKYFKNGYLLWQGDANGNKIHIMYNGCTSISENTASAAGANRITSVRLETKSGEDRVLFTLSYDSAGKLTQAAAAGNSGAAVEKVSLYHTASGAGLYQLTGIGRCRYFQTSSGSYAWGEEKQEAAYRYQSDGSHYRLTRIHDAESGYGVEYAYRKSSTGWRVYTYHEYASETVDGAQERGGIVRTYSRQMRQTRYRDGGPDCELETEDDVVTTYLFNSAGQTVNVRSEDASGETLGVSASAYEKNSGTDKKNNRLTEAVSSGQSSMNLLVNGGFEKVTETEADGWSTYKSSGSIMCRPYGSVYGYSYGGGYHYNLYGGSPDSGTRSIYQDAVLEGGETYTFSAYVNTKNVTFGSSGYFRLYAKDVASDTILGESIRLDHGTKESVDGGWQRLTVTFTVPDGPFQALYAGLLPGTGHGRARKS